MAAAAVAVPAQEDQVPEQKQEERPEQEEVQEQEGQDVDEDTRAMLEAFAALSMEDLRIMASRLMKCHEGFNEMLSEAVAEQQELKQEKKRLDAAIASSMQDIHKSRSQAKIRPVETVVVAAKAVQSFQVMNAQAFGKLHQQVAQKTSGLFQKGADFLANRKLAQTEAPRPKEDKKKKQKERDEKEGNDKQKEKDEAKSSTKEIDEAAKKLRKTPVGEPTSEAPKTNEASRLKKIVLKEIPAPASTSTAAPVPAAPAVALKKKPVVAAASVVNTVVIEAKITIPDGRVHMLNMQMAETCRDAARRFIHEHSQRAWFEAPLTAWLRKAEAEATKLPSRVEADLVELRKQHQKLVAAAAAGSSA